MPSKHADNKASLQCWIDRKAKAALDELAQVYGVSRAAFLTLLLIREHKKMTREK